MEKDCLPSAHENKGGIELYVTDGGQHWALGNLGGTQPRAWIPLHAGFPNLALLVDPNGRRNYVQWGNGLWKFRETT